MLDTRKTIQSLFMVLHRFCFVSLFVLIFGAASSAYGESDASTGAYVINAGDIIGVYVWKEESASVPESLVRPDGRISLPILGEVVAGGKSVDELQSDIASRLQKYLIDEPIVTVTLNSITGNVVYVLGKVARPGQFTIRGRTDVTQALALAGGTTTFANEDSIKILRRNELGEQTSFDFNYKRIERGKSLTENILLQSGDIVLVP